MLLVLALLAFAALSVLLLLASYLVEAVPDAEHEADRIRDLLALVSALTTVIAVGAAMLYRRRPHAYIFQARWISGLMALIVVTAIIVAMVFIGFDFS